MNAYVHGYSEREAQRLDEQSVILKERLHEGTRYPPGSTVLEAGCGVGAQTGILVERSPKAHFTSVDISPESLETARACMRDAGIRSVQFQQADLHDLPFGDGAFDHVFVCFVLEHLSQPLEALAELRRVLAPRGTITVIEGDHGSAFWHPETPAARRVWDCLVAVQFELGHDPLIGRRLHALLGEAGFAIDEVSPRWICPDSLAPGYLHGVVNQIMVPMVTVPEDMDRARSVVESAARELGIARIPPLVAMIETPAAALSVSDILRSADALSIGTNDLTQYVMAAGRQNPLANEYFREDHPAMMRLIRIICQDAGGSTVGMCGELAGRLQVIPELLHAGIRLFSVAPRLVPLVKEAVRRATAAPKPA